MMDYLVTQAWYIYCLPGDETSVAMLSFMCPKLKLDHIS